VQCCLSVDPLTNSYPWYTPYQFAGNKPINSIDRDGLEEYDSYAAYKKDYGDKAMSEDKWDGSDGAWLQSDRKDKTNRWKKAMESITKNGWSHKIVDKGSGYTAQGGTTNQKDIGSSFAVVRDYYLWAQSEMDKKDYKSRWAKGAAYLVDELADTYEEGVMSGGMVQRAGRLSVALNVAIKDFAVNKFKDALYGSGLGKFYIDGYRWDVTFVNLEQIVVAISVYEDWKGTKGLDVLNSLARKEGFFGNGAKYFSKHYIPAFSIFDNLNWGGDNGKATLNTPSNYYGQFYRVNIPLLMLWPSTHQSQMSLKLNEKQNKAANDAYDGVNKFYEKNKID
jgi:hypothetical protein